MFRVSVGVMLLNFKKFLFKSLFVVSRILFNRFKAKILLSFGVSCVAIIAIFNLRNHCRMFNF